MARAIDVAIIGGGPGGAAAAVAVRRTAPHLSVRVFERAGDLNRTGAAVGIPRNGMAAAEAISPECLRSVKQALVPKAAAATYTVQGEEKMRLTGDSAIFNLALWYKVQTGLLDLLPPDTLHLGCDLQSLTVTESDGVELQFRDQDPVRAKIVIGCDGNQSKVRSILLGDGRPNFVFSAAWRGIADTPDPWPYKDDMSSWFGGMPLGMVFVTNLGDGSLAWHVGMPWTGERLAELGDGRYIGGSTGKGSVEDRKQRCLTALGDKFADVLVELVQSTDPNAITEHGIFYRDPDACQVWGKGPVTLLGDAAHLASPALGQGASMALEDALELGRAIGAHGPTEAALREYERVRVPRATQVQRGSVDIARAVMVDGKQVGEAAWMKANSPWLLGHVHEPLVAPQVPA